MAENTKIQWADHTFNPWIGCSKVSAGCANCYAEKQMAHRLKRVEWGDAGTRQKTSVPYWGDPFKWNFHAAGAADRPRVFCASLADVFEDRAEVVPWRSELFDVIYQTQNMDWLLLTKRPENVRRFLWEALASDPDITEPHIMEIEPFAKTFSNVWFGCSVEDQDQAEKRIPELIKLRELSRVLFLSVEPLLGPIDLEMYLADIDWVIVGGESGPGSRPCDTEWINSIIIQCRDSGIPVFVKQIGRVALDNHSAVPMFLNHPKGGDPDEWPAGLRVRELPRLGVDWSA